MYKVVHLTTVHWVYDNRIFNKECLSLASVGNDVVLIATAEHEQEIGGVRVVPLRRQRNRALRMTAGLWQCYREAVRQNSELYHIHDPELLPVGQLLRLKGKRVVYDMHEFLPGSIFDKPWIPSWLHSVIAFCARVGERMLMHGLPVIFAESSYRKHYHWVEQWTTVLNFPDVERFSRFQSAPGDRFTVAYLGSVSADRGSKTMLEAVSILQQQGLDVAFECIGPASDSHVEDLEKLIADGAIRDVRLRGRLKQSEALPIVICCHVGLAVLQDRPNYRESYPTKMFEYMALGLPVVVSDFPLYRDVVERAACGICIPPDNPDALADAIYSLYADPVMATAMGKRGKCAVETVYNWSKEVAKLISFYDEVLQRD